MARCSSKDGPVRASSNHTSPFRPTDFMGIQENVATLACSRVQSRWVWDPSINQISNSSHRFHPARGGVMDSRPSVWDRESRAGFSVPSSQSQWILPLHNNHLHFHVINGLYCRWGGSNLREPTHYKIIACTYFHVRVCRSDFTWPLTILENRKIPKKCLTYIICLECH